MTKPSILIVSTSNKHPNFLLELITNTFCATIKSIGAHKSSYSWTIDTKYYTADVDIHGISESYQRDEDFNDAVKVLIIHTDCNSESGLADLSRWDSIQSECELEIKLLVSDYCDEQTAISTTEATEWCRKRGFEFIILHPNIEPAEEEEIIEEKIGIYRIFEVLQTCIWPNLQMKKATKSDSSKIESSSFNCELVNRDDIFEDMADDGLDEFTELFGQLHMMKESIQSLPGSERKQCAEQMVTAFWKAIGGDDDELLDL